MTPSNRGPRRSRRWEVRLHGLLKGSSWFVLECGIDGETRFLRDCVAAQRQQNAIAATVSLTPGALFISLFCYKTVNARKRRC